MTPGLLTLKVAQQHWIIIIAACGLIGSVTWVIATWDQTHGTSRSSAAATSLQSVESEAPPSAPIVTQPSASAPIGFGYTWATIPMPHAETVTPTQRIQYWNDVMKAWPGEPPLNKKLAAPLLTKLAQHLADFAEVERSAVTIAIGTSAATIKVNKGVQAGIQTASGALYVGVCSEAYLPAAMLSDDSDYEKLLALGVRGILCISDHCTAAADLRPSTPKAGFLYTGDRCLSMDNLVILALDMGRGR